MRAIPLRSSGCPPPSSTCVWDIVSAPKGPSGAKVTTGDTVPAAKLLRQRDVHPIWYNRCVLNVSLLGRPLEARKGNEQILLCSFQKKKQPYQHPDLSLVRHFRTSSLQILLFRYYPVTMIMNHTNTTNMCCFLPLCLHSLATTGN